MKIKTLISTALLVLASTSAFAANEVGQAPNELGKVMVLMYHHIVAKEDTWSRTPEKFREDLELLYSKGYYLVNLVDLVDGKLNVPKGKTPVVLTFDDTAPGQIGKIDGKWDPRTAVGIINDMYEKHPDFGRAGSFYLNPKSEDPAKKGSIPGLKRALKEMVELGYELGNHTVTHPHLNTLDQTGVEKELAGLQNWVESAVPGYQVRTMAMPHGIYPKEESWAYEGSYNGVHFKNVALLKVGSDPSVSPYSSKFRPYRIARVRGSEKLDRPNDYALAYIRGAISYFDKNPEQRFVSDGNPDTVTVPAKRLNEVRRDLPAGLTVKIQ
jgi:peptidoglycan/xylan/chitin deacetylase (PgdA/CDA1 family)